MSCLRRICLLLSLGLLTSAFVVAQQTGGGTGGGSTGSGTGGGTRGPTPSPTITNIPTTPTRNIPSLPPQQEQRRIFYFTGRVVYDDGTAAGSQISIERVCNGRARREGYTDSTGHFSISLGGSQDMGVMQDASVGSSDAGYSPFGMNSPRRLPGDMSQGITENDLMGCELRASAPRAWSDVIMLAGRHAMDNPDVGTIVLHRMGKVEGTRVSVTSLQAPKDAKKAFEHGEKAEKKQKWAEAQQDFAKAVGAYPRYAEAWVKLGVADIRLNRLEDARQAFHQALAADPKFMLPYFHLAVMAAGQRDWPQVAELTDKALALDAYEYPAVYYYNAVAYFEMHNLDKAEKSALLARRLDSQFRLPKIELVLGSVLLEKQDFSGAAQQLREFLKHTPSGPDADRVRAELADTEQKLAAKSPVK